MRPQAPLLLLFTLLAACARADAPKTVLPLDPAAAADNPALVTTDPAEEVGGKKSLKGDSRAAASEWNEFFHSKTGLLDPKKAYTLSFDYRVLARAADAKFYVLARRPGSTAGGEGWQEWKGQPGQSGHIETAFTPHEGGDVLIIGIQNKGALAIGGLTLSATPAPPPPAPPPLPAPKRTWKSPGGVSYFVDSARGRDAADGRSAAHAWRSLDRVNAGTFGPGDRILLRAGSQWAGFLSPGGSGAAGHPIILTRYGAGPKPAVDAQGKSLATFYLYNGEYWDVSGLDIANRAPVRQPKLAGVQVSLDNFGVAHDIRLRALDVHDVFGSNVKDAGGGNGISCTSGGDKIKTRYDGLLIEDCRLARTDRNGITLSAYYPRPVWPLSTRVVIRGNTLTDIGGDGIVPIGCLGCLIEHNTLTGGRMRALDYAAGIWPWSCDNTVVQFNEVSGMKGTMDGEGYDADYNCRHTLFQYNYSRDNDGGFMLICDDGSQNPPWNIGNEGTVIRYNISANDGLHTFNITGPCLNTQVYNNTFYLSGASDIPLVASGNWGGKWPADTRFFNNVFYAAGKSRFDFGGMTQVLFDHNAYWGALANRPADAHAVTADPRLAEPGGPNVRAYALRPGSPLFGVGRLVPDSGGRDFLGAALPPRGPAGIGAFALPAPSSLGPARTDKAGLPVLPAGRHWRAYVPLTDEFTGTRLDSAKWQPRHPYWAGRDPSRFDPANVSVAAGALLLRSTPSVQNMAEVRDPLKDLWVRSSCVSSLLPVARYGYYEARLKASDLPMTSSFWLQGKYSEIDVVEQIGHSLKNPENGKQMLMNTHYFAQGWDHDTATPRKAPMSTGAAQAYHTYGVWWRDAKTVTFFLDGKQVAEATPAGPFGEPMYLFFDTEVFAWEGLPTVESLRDPRRNAMSVDWVRAWTPVRDEQKAAPGGVTWERGTLRPFAAHAGRFYRYAPSALADGPRDWCWTCQNAHEGVIKDSIFLTRRAQGVVQSNRPALMASAPGRWDSFHVCDPSVVGGRFRLAGRDYRYALLYLGNDVNASRHNQIGVAFANSLDGPWTRAPEPLVAHADDGTWGVGQPSAVCTDDKHGRVLLFYTRGDREGARTLCREVRLQDMGKGFESGPDVTLTNAGLTGADGRPDILNDADFAYDPARHRFYALREQHPHPQGYPAYIGASLQLVSLPAENARRGGGVWRVEGAITPALTGQARNHNGGLVRTLAGSLSDPRRVRVLFTSSGAGPGVPVAEWTYDLWEITGRLAP